MSTSPNAATDSCLCVVSRVQPQRYPDPKLGQLAGQYPINFPAAAPSGQQQHPRPFTSLMHGQAGAPTPAMGQPGGTQVASQAAMYSPRGPPNSMAQPRPQLGVPQMVQGQPTIGQVQGQALGQQPGMPKAAPGQMQYHPPLGESSCPHMMLT